VTTGRGENAGQYLQNINRRSLKARKGSFLGTLGNIFQRTREQKSRKLCSENIEQDISLLFTLGIKYTIQEKAGLDVVKNHSGKGIILLRKARIRYERHG
jgi:hypothetical protein